ncbi:MAG: hypothetical protein ACI8W8_002003 [Rhodothermales bacterium]|jgi:hypothetical protein
MAADEVLTGGQADMVRAKLKDIAAAVRVDGAGLNRGNIEG